jgi:hypothetical protein
LENREKAIMKHLHDLPFLPGELPQDMITQSGRVSSPPELFMEQVCTDFDDCDIVEDL